MTGATAASFLDRPAARLCAAGIFALCLAALAWLHRGDLFPQPAAADPAAACVRERTAIIDAQRRDGIITAAQAELFRDRAAAICAARNRRETGGIPPLPGR